MKKFLTFKYLLPSIIILSFAYNKPSFSTHIVGGELRYECLDANMNTYKITFKLYRDCSDPNNLQLDSTIYIAIYDTLEVLINGPSGLSMPLLSVDTLTNPVNTCLFPVVCVEEAIYEALYTFGPNYNPTGSIT